MIYCKQEIIIFKDKVHLWRLHGKTCTLVSIALETKLCSMAGWMGILQLPADIQWHFVGHLQSNKAKALVCEFHQFPSLFLWGWICSYAKLSKLIYKLWINMWLCESDSWSWSTSFGSTYGNVKKIVISSSLEWHGIWIMWIVPGRMISIRY